MITIVQTSNAFNSHMFNLFFLLFKSMDITVNIREQKNIDKKPVLHFTVEGIQNIFVQLLPLLIQYVHYFYWKK